MLESEFRSLIARNSGSLSLAEELWKEIVSKHSDRKRHYHTLEHLHAMLDQLKDVQQELEHWDAVLFALYYHDAVYKSRRSDNEEQSAALAERRMRELNVPEALIGHCHALILATKKHEHSDVDDINYFTDADLSILGQRRELYMEYMQQVRKEYSVYPDFLYKPGRRKVVQHFLSMERIFKTDYFFQRLEEEAKSNLRFEWEQLNA